MSIQIDSLVKMNADDASLKEILKDTCMNPYINSISAMFKEIVSVWPYTSSESPP